jgi:GNAT superfamily N-acetyltransferase
MLPPGRQGASDSRLAPELPAPIRFVKAGIEDADLLTEIQKRAFDDDSQRFAGRPAGGPPGYDSVGWTLWAMKAGIYFRILAGNRVVGGLILFDMHKRHFNLGRIFVDPGWQNRGIGAQAVRFVEKAFPYVTRWSLDTPEWAVRNHHFYEKLGYVKVGEEIPTGIDFRLYLYEKRMP